MLRKIAILAFLTIPGGVAADWNVVRNGRFEIYSQESEAAARAALLWFEQLHAAVQQQTGVDVSGRTPLRVIGFASDAEYSRYRPGPAADAYYVGAPDRDCIVMPSLAESSFATAAHEYSHVIQHSMQRHLPPWLSEGLADLFSTLRIDKRGSRVGGEVPGRLDVLRRGTWIPLDLLLGMSEPVKTDRVPTAMFYAQSWALTEMLSLSPAYRSHFGAMIQALASGSNSATALTQTYGKPLEAIQHDVVAWANGRRGKPISLEPIEPDLGTVTVARVSAESVQIIMGQLLLTTGDVAGAEAVYRDVARQSPGSAEALAGLGAVAAARKQFDQARDLWKRAIAAGLSDSAICFRYAELLDRSSAAPDERRAALLRAIEFQPGFDDARWMLAMLENNAGHADAALVQLEAMSEIPAARAFHYWCTMADVLTSLGRVEDAKAAASRASEHAANHEERTRAARLAYIAQTRLAVRMTRDAQGNPRMVTTRIPNDATDFNPFVEPSDDLRRAQGVLQDIDCKDGMRFIVETSSSRLTLTVADPKRVQMRNAPAEFVCGPQQNSLVVVEYAATVENHGIVRGIEFK